MAEQSIRKPTLEDFVRQRAGDLAAAPLAVDEELLRRYRGEYQAIWGEEPLEGAGTASGFFEVELAFADLAAWRGWLDDNPWCLNPGYNETAVASIRNHGFEHPWQGRAMPADVSIDTANLRESLIFRGINSRCRAVLSLISKTGLGLDAGVYAPESVTPLAKALKAQFPHVVGSEYLPTLAERLRFPGTRHEDVQALSLKDGSLDLYVSCEVMEHIPSFGAAMREAARILRPGGFFIATFPFRIVDEETEFRAKLENGVLRHLAPPEYHGNPVDPQGSLVFQIPGWDVLPLARRCGFSRAEMVMISSRRQGILANLPVAVFRGIR